MISRQILLFSFIVSFANAWQMKHPPTISSVTVMLRINNNNGNSSSYNKMHKRKCTHVSEDSNFLKQLSRVCVCVCTLACQNYVGELNKIYAASNMLCLYRMLLVAPIIANAHAHTHSLSLQNYNVLRIRLSISGFHSTFFSLFFRSCINIFVNADYVSHSHIHAHTCLCPSSIKLHINTEKERKRAIICQYIIFSIVVSK